MLNFIDVLCIDGNPQVPEPRGFVVTPENCHQHVEKPLAGSLEKC